MAEVEGSIPFVSTKDCSGRVTYVTRFFHIGRRLAWSTTWSTHRRSMRPAGCVLAPAGRLAYRVFAVCVEQERRCAWRALSAKNAGREVSVSRLAAIMLELQDAGALNVNLVTPLHFAPQVRTAVLKARAAGLAVPIVCNTSGYETPETIGLMSDVVDVWLTDFKYASEGLARRLSNAAD